VAGQVSQYMCTDATRTRSVANWVDKELCHH